MDDRLIAEIKAFVLRHPLPKLAPDAMLSAEDFRKRGYTPRVLFPVASKRDVAKAEAELGFALPPLLTRLFLEVSNGIAGFAYDIMGLQGGCASDSGTLVEGYLSFKAGEEYETGLWKVGMLPFCNWGCAIYSCVDCADASYPVFTYEDSGVWPERYSLPEFFEMWLKGKVLFSQENVEVVTKEGTNPFTAEKMTISGRRRRKLES
jgi:SMI1-KNR4 cell-wall